ncbi:MAG: peptidase inhibitor family I36 protein [Nostoc sp.]|uniref:peptidase inhibitor family I36 protein n=1 Tax=Nostoc sp. TaxID=1180 RepID=UPI002FF11CB0
MEKPMKEQPITSADKSAAASRRSRQTARPALTLLLAMTSLVTAVGIASPATANSADCPSGKFCIWTNSTYNGSFAYFAKGSANLANPIGGYVFNNKVTSIWNRTGSAWCLYDGANYKTLLLRQSAGGYRANLAVERIDNKTSSLKSC